MKHFSQLSPAAVRVADVAERLIQERGFGGMSYEDLAGELGIRKASVYHHFPGKDMLGMVVAQRHLHRTRKVLLDLESLSPCAEAALRGYVAHFQDTYANGRRLCPFGMLGAEHGTLSPALRAEIERFFRVNLDWLTEILARGRHAGEFLHAQPDAVVARHLFCALEGAMVVGRGMAEPTAVSDLGSAFIDALCRRAATP